VELGGSDHGELWLLGLVFAFFVAGVLGTVAGFGGFFLAGLAGLARRATYFSLLTFFWRSKRQVSRPPGRNPGQPNQAEKTRYEFNSGKRTVPFRNKQKQS
jgi:hypothetical protein